ncbi:hypothetical protein [Polaromonas sp. CG9_12]|nr:hypothetical protein [Polaromonas sp. CG9_12]
MERVWQKDDANRAEAITDIADYIVKFHNAVRLHSTQIWATFHPLLSSINQHPSNFSSCPK